MTNFKTDTVNVTVYEKIHLTWHYMLVKILLQQAKCALLIVKWVVNTN